MKDWQSCWKRVSNEPRQFGKSFLISLWNVDNGRIRLRWSEEHEKYVIERKVLPSTSVWEHTMAEFKKRRDGKVVRRDSFIQAQDGYVGIDMALASAPFESRLCENLRYFNLERWGGAKGFTRHIEEKELMREVAAEKSRDDRWEQLANDQYEDMIWRSGERAVVPSNYDSIDGPPLTDECWKTHKHSYGEERPLSCYVQKGPVPTTIGTTSVIGHGALGQFPDYPEQDLAAKPKGE